MEEIRELVATGYSLIDAKESVMADKKPSITPTLSTKSYSVAKTPTLSGQKGNNIVKASNLLVRKQKLFLTAEESRHKIEKFKVEIVLQKSQISLKKKGMNGAETEIANDVFTIFEHPLSAHYGEVFVGWLGWLLSFRDIIRWGIGLNRKVQRTNAFGLHKQILVSALLHTWHGLQCVLSEGLGFGQVVLGIQLFRREN